MKRILILTNAPHEWTSALHGGPFLLTSPVNRDEFMREMGRFPHLMLIDTSFVAFDWEGEIRGLRVRPGSPLVPVLGFGEVPVAGSADLFDQVISQKLLAGHPRWILSLYARPDFTPAEAARDLPSGIREGIRLFNEGRFHESHDAIEAVWLKVTSDIRLLYQGILQAGIVFYMLEKNKPKTALKMCRLALLKIRHFLPRFQGIELEKFYSELYDFEKQLKEQKRTKLPPYPRMHISL